MQSDAATHGLTASPRVTVGPASSGADRTPPDVARMLGGFLALVTHELRKSLTPALLLTSYLELREELPSELREDAQLIRTSIEQQSKLIDELADVASLTSGKLKLPTGRQDVHELLRAILLDVEQPNADRTSLELHAADSAALIEPTRLRQALLAVLSHAWHCSEKGGRVRVVTANKRGRLTLVITHGGSGYEPSRLARLFDAFDTSARSRTGSGLGLDLVLAHGYLRAMGGELIASSDGADCGASYTFDIPLAHTAETI